MTVRNRFSALGETTCRCRGIAAEVKAALFPSTIPAGFRLMSSAGTPSPLVQQAYELARAQICERRAARYAASRN